METFFWTAASLRQRGSRFLSPDTIAWQHKTAIATSKNSLHIPLEQKGQLPRERRAVGAAKAAARRLFRSKVLENACLWGFFPKECGIFGKNDLNCLSRIHRLAS